MYLCDQMNAIVDVLGEDDPFIRGSSFIRWMRSKMVDVLDHSEIFIMERSALTAAGNLRLGDPDRLERMLSLVLNKPGRIFIECSHRQREEEMSTMLGGGNPPIPEGRYLPQRIGLDIHITEPGRAVIQPFWCFPKHVGAEGIPVDLPGGRLRRDAVKHISAMGISYGRLVVDVNGRTGETFAEFCDRMKRDGMPDVLKKAALSVLGATKVTERRLLQAAWREERMATYSRFDFDMSGSQAIVESLGPTGRTLEEAMEASQRDLDGELIYAIGLLAVLQARKDTSAFIVEERKARPTRSIKRPRLQDMGLPRLSVVNLRKEAGRRGSNANDSISLGDSKGRIRHPVSGHLFLARNGEMVWRREHYRGSLDGRQAKRVG